MLISQSAEDSFQKMVLKGRLSNRWWRLCNLYWIENENGKVIKFRPNWAQFAFYKLFWWLNVILKARQLGLSTFIMLLELDRALFNSNQTCGLIDKTEEDAKKKLARIKFSYEQLDREGPTQKLGAAIKEARVLTTANTTELGWSNGSKVWAGTSLRGGTINFLWISELGAIAFHDPKKAKEIKAGALNTVHQGNVVVIESTHEGGKYGLNYEMIKIAQAAPDEESMTVMDWRFHFFPWWKDPKYTLKPPGHYVLPAELVTYFAELLKDHKIELTEDQRFWYWKKSITQGDAMWKEFPSTPEEAVNAVVTGAIYGKLMSQARREGRIREFPPERGLPIYSFFDIGISDYGVFWLVQFSGRDILLLACYSAHGQDAAWFAERLVDYERRYQKKILVDYLPHDANQRSKGNSKTFREEMIAAGRKDVRVVPRIPDEWLGIGYVRKLFNRFWFHKVDCDVEFESAGGDIIIPSGIACADAFHVVIEETGAAIREMPLHDRTSHAMAALRTMAEAYERGMIEGNSETARESRTEGHGKPVMKIGLSKAFHPAHVWRRRKTY